MEQYHGCTMDNDFLLFSNWIPHFLPIVVVSDSSLIFFFLPPPPSSLTISSSMSPPTPKQVKDFVGTVDEFIGYGTNSPLPCLVPRTLVREVRVPSTPSQTTTRKSKRTSRSMQTKPLVAPGFDTFKGYKKRE